MRSSCFVIASLLLCVVRAPGQEFVWARHMGGTTDDYSERVAVDASGNVYTTGTFGEFNRTVDFDPGPGVFNLTASGEFDVFVSKLDSAGNFVWARQLGGDRLELSGGIAVDRSGNVHTTGQFYGTTDFDPGPSVFNLTPIEQADTFVSKLDSVGNFLWARQFGRSSGRNVAADDNGNVFTTGSFFGTADFDPGPGVFNLTSSGFGDIFITKLDPDGSFVWAAQMGGVSSEIGLGVTVHDGDVYSTGDFRGPTDFDPGPGVFELTPPGGRDVFVSKLDSDGNFVWARQMGGSGLASARGWGVAVDGSGNVHTVGHFSETADFDPGTSVFHLTSAGLDDVFVSKLDNAGNFVWTRRIGGADDDLGYGIAIDASGRVFTTGSFRGTVDFDPGSGVFHLSTVLGVDPFISRLDSAGNFVWAQQMTGTGFDAGRGVAVDDSGNVYATGNFAGTGDFDPDGSGFNLTASGDADIFVAKYKDVTTTVQAPSINEGGVVLATLLPTVSTISPLSIISVFGEHFSGDTVLFPNLVNGRVDYRLGGACLLMNGEPLPIFAVTPGQINAQASASYALGPATFVVVTNCGTPAATSSFPLTAVDPGRAAATGSQELASSAVTATVEEATPGFFLFDPVTSDGFIAARFNATESQAPVPVAPEELFPDDSYVKGGVNLDHFGGAKVDQLVKG